MRILFLTCHLPYPPVSGGRRREYELLTRLGGEFEIQLCAVSKTYREDRLNAAALLDHCASVEVFPAEGAGLDPDAPRREPWQVARHRSRLAEAHVADAVWGGTVDAVHVEGFYLVRHLPWPCPPTLLVEQNVEYQLWRQRAEAATDARRRRRLLRESRLTQESEIEAWRRSDLCGAITDDDRRAMLDRQPDLEVHLIPDGADHSSGFVGAPVADDPPIARNGSPLVVFTANFGYEPNADAAVHLATDIFPRVLGRCPSARLLLVGTSPPPEVTSLGSENVEVTGRVPAVEPYLTAADVVVCPLRVGGGVKVKMLEALRHGKAAVSTSVGVQGLGPDVRSSVRVEDAPGDFAAAVARLCERPEERRRLEAAARRFAAGLPTWDDAADALATAYGRMSALGERSGRARTRVAGIGPAAGG